MAEEGRSLHYFDGASFTADPVPEISLAGWCASPTFEPLEELWAESDGCFYPCLTGVARPDLCIYFGRLSMARAGFVARVPVRNGEACVRFYVPEGERQRLVFSWNGQTTVTGGAGVFLDAGTEPAPNGPLISILLPAPDAALYYLYRSVRSLLNQSYANWELCVAYAGSSDATARYLRSPASEDRRIRLFDCGSAERSTLPSIALGEAAGEFCGILNAADELHPAALAQTARVLRQDPSAEIIHTDERQMDACGNRTELIHKPAFRSEELPGGISIGRLACIRTSSIRRLGGLHPEFGAAQEWDLLLRLSETAAPANIHHIAQPLYFRRDTGEASDEADRSRVAAACLARRGAHASPGRSRLREASGTAVFVRMEDGPSQLRLLFRTRIPSGTKFFEMRLGAVYPLDPAQSGPVLSMDELSADVAIFINRALDHVSHKFLEELATEARRRDCGIAGPLKAGSGIWAVRAELLAEAGGLAAIRDNGAMRLCNKMAELGRKKGLKILRTPHAAATLRRDPGPHLPRPNSV